MSTLAHLLAILLTCLVCTSAMAAEKPRLTLAWSIYAGWMPWENADSNGIIDRWASRYGIEIDIVQINDCIESVDQYTAGQFDAVIAIR